MNGINILIIASFIANILVLVFLFIMLVLQNKNIIETLTASHKVLYAKMTAITTITDKLDALFKHLDIEEETKKVAHITKINGKKAEVNNTMFVSPQNIEQLRGHDFSVIHIDKDCIPDIDLKLFYDDILIPMRIKNNTIVDFHWYKNKK